MADEKQGQQYELFKYATLFPYVAPPADIEQERQSIEHDTGLKVVMHSMEIVTRSGARCTRVEWRVI